MSGTEELEFKTERLTLKPAAPGDLKVVSKIVNDPFVRRYLFDDEVLKQNQIAELINLSRETFDSGKYGLWLIILDETSEVIGFTGLWHFFDEAQPQLLYALLPEFTRRGIVAEAARKIIEYAFSELSFEYLDASCDLPNEASQQAALRLGMKIYRREAVNGLATVFFRLENK